MGDETNNLETKSLIQGKVMSRSLS